MALPLLAAALLGCAGRASPAGEGVAARPRTGHGIVIPGPQLWARGGDLLQALVGRVSNMRVERSTGRCPRLTIRGQKTFLGNPEPLIYVEGSPSLDTCVLHEIRARDVERVEVYPSGFTDRPGYASSPNGLILVFLTGARSPR